MIKKMMMMIISAVVVDGFCGFFAVVHSHILCDYYYIYYDCYWICLVFDSLLTLLEGTQKSTKKEVKRGED